jgi:ppGpp synthetase/RelA/SpoT-type nucleotidyltranferase
VPRKHGKSWAATCGSGFCIIGRETLLSPAALGRNRRVGDSNTGGVRAWLAEQVAEYKRVFPHYRRYAEVLRQLLQREARDHAPLALVQTREKSVASFAEKALRKKHKYSDPVRDMTDLCGGRVIARTRAEVDALCGFLERDFEIDWNNSLDTSRRLKPTEFGYRSVHYIVSLRRDVDYSVEIPEELYGCKAEVQVRTVVEHAYADFAHDLTYKGAFRLPIAWQRELASAAAALEEVDQTFERMEERLRAYASTYGTYLSEDELQTEIDRLEIVLEHDPQNTRLAARLGKLAITKGDWQKAIEVLSHYARADDLESTYQPILRDLGVALCKAHRKWPKSNEYRMGQRYLELASESPHADVDALGSLAGTWKGIDETKVREYYRRAFEINPTDPYALGNYLECELENNTAILPTARPMIQKAIERCQALVEAGINLPWAFYDMGRFHLLLGQPYRSLDAYAKAIEASSAPFMIETSLSSLERLSGVALELHGYEWILRLLLLGLATRFSSAEATERLRRMASEGAAPLRSPVLIVAGGTASRVEAKMRGYSEYLLEALAGFEGTIVSGGTTQGICRLVGDVAAAYPQHIHSIGYLPALIPADATVDNDRKRYTELRYTDGRGFTPLEPLQNWIDLIASGISPSEVRVVGINGGGIAGAEYRIALALGARVGLVAQSGREAGRLSADTYWSSHPRVLVNLPKDAQTLRAFVGSRALDLSAEVRDSIAKAIHEEYRATRVATGQIADPAMSEWGELPDDLKESNRDQARHIAEKLRHIGCFVDKAGASADKPVVFTREEVEAMARMEHGRYNAERLLDGWRWGEVRDPQGKTNPHLISWDELPEEVRKIDRQTVRKIPEFLAAVGLRVRRAKPEQRSEPK